MRAGVPELSFESGRDFEEGGFEFFHFFLGANGDSAEGGPNRPDSADIDFLAAEGLDDLCGGAFYVDHEFIGDRGDEVKFVPAEKLEAVFSDLGDDLAALGDEIWRLQAGRGGNHRGDWQGTGLVLADSLQKIGPRQRRTGAQARHTIEL